jgi:hypothetical protein
MCGFEPNASIVGLRLCRIICTHTHISQFNCCCDGTLITGVEHLLRDVKDTTVSSLAQNITAKLHSLTGLHERLLEMQTYLENVCTGKMPVNNEIIYRFETQKFFLWTKKYLKYTLSFFFLDCFCHQIRI